MRYVIWLCVWVWAGSALAGEVSVEFRHHPDRSGQQTANQSIEAEEDDGEFEAKIDEPGPGGEREAAISAEQYAQLVALVRAGVEAFEFADAEKVEGAYVEVMLEYQAEGREVEVAYRYAAGAVPEVYVELQERYFKQAYQ